MIEEIAKNMANETVELGLYLPKATHRSLRAAAKRSGISMNGWIRGAISEKLDREVSQ